MKKDESIVSFGVCSLLFGVTIKRGINIAHNYLDSDTDSKHRCSLGLFDITKALDLRIHSTLFRIRTDL